MKVEGSNHRGKLNCDTVASKRSFGQVGMVLQSDLNWGKGFVGFYSLPTISLGWVACLG